MEVDITRVAPKWLRRFVRALLPSRVVDALKDRVLHLAYHRTRSAVSRESRLTVAARRLVRAKPVLFHLDVHLADHCNLRCRGCSHFSNVAQPRLTDVDEFEADFRRMSELFAVKEIFLLGGEPLLHPQADRFVRVAKECFPSARTYLFTNGLLVTRMSEPLWDALAETGVVLYCDDYAIDLPKRRIDEMAAERGVAVKWTEPRDRFFTIPIDLDGGQDAAASFHACSGVDNCVNLRHGRLFPCARIAYIDIFLDHFGLDGMKASSADSVSIYEESDAWAILDFLLRPVPWCRHCVQDDVQWYPWSRGDRSIEQWTSPSTVGHDESPVSAEVPS